MKKNNKWIRFYVFLALAIILLIVVFFGYKFAPYDPLETDFANILSAPDKEHLFGTDNLGRDVLSRILYGASSSFSLTFLMIAIVATIGTII